MPRDAQIPVLTTATPSLCVPHAGATNLVTGLADALLDSVPLVAITGQVRAAPAAAPGCSTSGLGCLLLRLGCPAPAVFSGLGSCDACCWWPSPARCVLPCPHASLVSVANLAVGGCAGLLWRLQTQLWICVFHNPPTPPTPTPLSMQVPRKLIGSDAFQETPIVEVTRQVGGCCSAAPCCRLIAGRACKGGGLWRSPARRTRCCSAVRCCLTAGRSTAGLAKRLVCLHGFGMTAQPLAAAATHLLLLLPPRRSPSTTSWSWT